jgi:ribosome maturation factor RimP
MARGDSPGSRPSGLARDDAVRTAVAALASRAGFDVEDVTVRLAGGRRLVRLVVDRDGGVDLDAAAALSRDLSAALDGEHDAALGDAAYTLEVTSRGVGAPLTEPRHFRRAVGRLATIVRRDGSSLTARIAGCGDTGLALLSGPDGVTPLTLPLTEVSSAKVEVEFSPPPERVAAALAELRGWPDGDDASDLDAPGTEGDDAR